MNCSGSNTEIFIPSDINDSSHNNQHPQGKTTLSLTLVNKW